MKHEPHVTNATIWEIDWARNDRQRFLASIPPYKPRRSRDIAPGVPASAVWMQDVSGMDRRSVKAQLAGRGDGRARWWAWNVGVDRLMHGDAPLEVVMVRFHRRHQRMTWAWLCLASLFRAVRDAVAKGGVEAGWSACAAEEQRLAALWQAADSACGEGKS